mgnify:CR=1 FL=1
MKKEIKLNLGCWHRNFGDDWVHIDQCYMPHISSHDIINLPFESNSVDLIYASHVISYWDRVEVIDVLRNWKRFLKKGGILRLAVPDFGVMSNLYQDGKVTLDDLLGPVYGHMQVAGEVIYHKTTYDHTSLIELLDNVGFNNIRRWDWRKVDHGIYDDHSQAYMAPKGDKENGTLISLNVECTK